MTHRHNSSFTSHALFFLTLLIISAATAFGQNAAARPDRGLVTSGAYAVSDIENISLSNGNVGVSIPLAGLPPIAGGKLSYTVKATYNSKLSNVVRYQQDYSDDTDWSPYTVSAPQQAGGWVVGGGYRIYIRNADEDFDRLIYPGNSGLSYQELDLLNNHQWYKVFLQTPDGGERELRPTGYAGSSYSYLGTQDFLRGYFRWLPNAATGTKYHSFDGTYVAAIIKSAMDWTVFLPDGMQVVQTPDGIQRIKDTNGNSIKIFTDGNGTHYQDEQTGREIRTTYDPAGNGGLGQGQVLYQTVGGTWQTVTINYGTTHVQGKPYQVTDWLPHGAEMGGGTTCDRYSVAAYDVYVVREIIFPQTEPGEAARRFTFGYNSDTAHNATVTNFRWSCDQPYQNQTFTSSIGWGQLSQMVTPAGAMVKYSYSLDANEQAPMIDPDEVARESITQKQVVHESPAITDTWDYVISDSGGGVNNPDGTSASETKYNHSPGYAYSIGKAGLVYRSVQNGVITERHWVDMPFAGASLDSPGGAVNFNPVVDAEYTTINNAGGQPSKMSAKTFQRDYNGNVTDVTEYDWFDPGDVQRDEQGVPTGVPGAAPVLRTTSNSYHNTAATAGSANVYAVRSLTAGVPSIINALQQTTVGAAITRLNYDGQAYGVAPTVGNLTSKQVWDDLDNKWLTTSLTYGLNGNVATTTDARGKVTQFYYEDATRAAPNRVVVDPENDTGTQTATTAYDYYTGLVTSRTDVNGNISTIDYTNQLLNAVDPFGRPGVVIGPSINLSGTNQHQRVTTTYRDASRQLIVATDLNAENDKLLKSRTTSDMLGRLILSEQSEDGTNYTITARKAYDTASRTAFTSNPMRSTAAASDGWTRVTTDTTGRVTEVATFGGAAQPPISGTNSLWTGSVTTNYDANFTTVADQAGKLRRSKVDGLGRLVRVDEPDGNNSLGSTTSPAQPTSYTYDVLGNLRTVAQGMQMRTFTYDSLSRLRSAVNPESGTITYAYDDNGNLTLKTDARNITTSYAYDALNRPTTRSYSDDTPAVNYVYDAPEISNGKGRLTSVDSSASAYRYHGYDAMGRAGGLTQTLGSQDYLVSYSYDLSGHVSSITYPSGRVVNYSYDTAGRLNGVTGNLGDDKGRKYATGITYDAGARMTKERFGTDTAIFNKLRYNSRGQLAEILESSSYTGPADTTWNRGKITNDYSLQCTGVGCNAADNNGNLRRQIVSVPNNEQNSSATSWQQQYDYDSLNRLTQVHEYAGVGLDWQQAFTYDQYGNRKINGAATYGQGINSMQAAVDPNTLTNRLYAPNDPNHNLMDYDPAGNQTKDYLTGNGERIYDAENRMITATHDGNTNEYRYDGDGHRVKRIVANERAETWQVYGLSGELLAEYDAADEKPVGPQKEYGYRNGQLLITAAPGSEAPCAPDEVCVAESGERQVEIEWLVTDQLGTPRMIFNHQGSLAGTKRHDYLPFGEELFPGTGQRANTLGYSAPDGVRQKFTQKERDTETGLDYFVARYYSSPQGRFTSVDPSRASAAPNDPQSWNRYSYALNKPLAYVDKNGKWPTEIHELIIDRALPGLSAKQRQEIKNGSWSVDDPLKGGQLTSHANEHGMTIPGQSQDDAAFEADNFINNNVDAAKYNHEHHGLISSLYDFGRAFHTVSDMTSPSHEGYEVWYVRDLRTHRARESSINNYRMGLAVGATLKLYAYTYGQAELNKATGYTPGSADDPSVIAINSEFALPGSSPLAEAEALFDYRKGLRDGLNFDWDQQAGRRGRAR